MENPEGRGYAGRMTGSLDDESIIGAVRAHLADGLRTMEFVNAHPELAHREVACAAHLAEVLEAAGYRVERGVADMPTAFTAELEGAHPGATVGIIAMYDAVPVVGADGEPVPTHACGHGPIAGGVVAMALALADLRAELRGRIRVVGCPADEIHAPETRRRGGGKAISAAAGLWDDVDVALYTHPEFIDTVSTRSLWMQRQRVRLHGTRTLRNGPVPAPLELLHAVSRHVADADPSRVMLERLVIDGDVEEGTGLFADATFLLFADEEHELEAAIGELKAALPAGEWSETPRVAGVRADEEVTALVKECFLVVGRDFVDEPPALPFATDFGNISHRAPAALIGIGREGGWGFHTALGAEQFQGEEGRAFVQPYGEIMALAAVRAGSRGRR